MTELVLPGVTYAYANLGQWGANCSYEDRCGIGRVLPTFAEGFICRYCGGATAVVWPSAEMVAGIERLLLMRPHWKHQNWEPPETLEDLIEQNLDHGIFTSHAPSLSAGLVFSTVDDRVVTDALPTLNPRRELVR